MPSFARRWTPSGRPSSSRSTQSAMTRTIRWSASSNASGGWRRNPTTPRCFSRSAGCAPRAGCGVKRRAFSTRAFRSSPRAERTLRSHASTSASVARPRRIATTAQLPIRRCPRRFGMSVSAAAIAQVRDLARARLCSSLGTALVALPNDLYALGARSQSLGEHRILGHAVVQVEVHGAKIAAAFEREFVAVFDAKCVPRAAPTLQAMSLSQATLVDDAQMEQQIALGNLARKTRFELDVADLYAIEMRIGELAAGMWLEGDANPVGPEAVFEALRRACEAAPTEGAVKLAILNALQPHIGLALGPLYHELNDLLAQQGVVPAIRHTVEKSLHAPAGAGTAGGIQPTGIGTVALSQAISLRDLLPLSASMPIDLTGIVTAYLQGPPEMRRYGARMLADPAGSLFTHAMATEVDSTLLSELSALQGAAAPGAERSTDAGDLLAVLQHLARTRRHPLDQLTGELIAVVFDYLLHNGDIAAAVKEQIARLQIVAFKAALLDRSFFARREHPLRELLTAIADAATDPEIDTDPDRRFVPGLRAVVDEVLAGFSEDLAVFVTARERVGTLVGELRHESEQAAAALAAAIAEQERLAEARARAATEIERRATAAAPEFVRKLLMDTWSGLLVEAAEHQRTGDDSWDARLRLIDELFWSLEPKSAADVPRLTAMLPKLVAGLSAGMKAVGTPSELRQAFFDELMRAHAALLQATKTQRAVAPKPTPPPASPPRQAAAIDVPELAGDAAPPLERGAIVEFADVEPPVRARLCWVNPKRTVYLFMARGANSRQMSSDELAAALRKDEVRVIKGGSAIVEHALAAVIGDVSKA